MTRRKPATKVANVANIDPVKFGAALTRISRFAERDRMLFTINGVRIEHCGTNLALVATDRFSIGAETVPLPLGGEPDAKGTGTTFIPLASMPLVKAVLDSHRHDFSVEFDLDTGFFAGVQVAQSVEFPEWRSILKGAAERPESLETGVDFDCAKLLTFERAYRGRELRVRFCGSNNPILVTANNFVGALMPMPMRDGGAALEGTLRDLAVLS